MSGKVNEWINKEENIDYFEWKERVFGFGKESDLRQWPRQLTFQSVEIQSNQIAHLVKFSAGT